MIHITQSQLPASVPQPKVDKLSDDESIQAPTDCEKRSQSKPNIEITIDEEKGDTRKEIAVPSSFLSSPSDFSVPSTIGRPNAGAKIHEVVNSTRSSDSIIVAACGPARLMLDVRQAVADVLSTGARSISLHCEQFGWWVELQRISALKDIFTGYIDDLKAQKLIADTFGFLNHGPLLAGIRLLWSTNSKKFSGPYFATSGQLLSMKHGMLDLLDMFLPCGAWWRKRVVEGGFREGYKDC